MPSLSELAVQNWREEQERRFRSSRTPQDIADLLQISYSRLAYYVHELDESARYRTFQIRKRKGGTRSIAEPCRTLKIAQRRLADLFELVYTPKPSVHGYVRGRSIATNAQVHVRKRYVLNVDIEGFFPAVNFGRVRGMLMAEPYSFAPAVATFLAQLCCFNNTLPQGAPTSPIIANMICSRLDSALQRLAKRHRCSYTRYADDITFSTTGSGFPSQLAKRNPDSGVVEAGPELSRVIAQNGFEINTSKVRLQRQHRRQEVTGLVVNRFANVPRKYVRQVRAMLHAWDRYTLDGASREFFAEYDTKDRRGFEREADFAAVVKGKIDYLTMIRGRDDAIVQKFLEKFAELNPGFVPRPIAPEGPSHGERIREALWVLECEEDSIQGTAFGLSGYGLITCAHVLGTRTVAFRADDPTQVYPVEVIASDSALDLAVLRIEGPPGYELRRARTSELRYDESITVAGFPNFRHGDSGWVSSGLVTGTRNVSTVRRLLVDTPIVAGCSGGPVLNSRSRVIGIAATGARRMEEAAGTEHHGVIPIETLDRLISNSARERNRADAAT